jgi:hypothetical protein
MQRASPRVRKTMTAPPRPPYAQPFTRITRLRDRDRAVLHRAEERGREVDRVVQHQRRALLGRHPEPVEHRREACGTIRHGHERPRSLAIDERDSIAALRPEVATEQVLRRIVEVVEDRHAHQHRARSGAREASTLADGAGGRSGEPRIMPPSICANRAFRRSPRPAPVVDRAGILALACPCPQRRGLACSESSRAGAAA